VNGYQVDPILSTGDDADAPEGRAEGRALRVTQALLRRPSKKIGSPLLSSLSPWGGSRGSIK